MSSAWWDGFRQDLRASLRSCARNPGFAAVVVVTLAVGIGVNAVVFSFVAGVLLTPFPFASPERLVLVREADAHRDLSPSFPNYTDWAAQAQSFSSLGAVRAQELSLSGATDPERVAGARATATLFSTLGVPPLLGRPFASGDDRVGAAPVALIGHGLWTRRFGADPDVVGRSIVLDGRTATVVGVMPRDFRFPAVAELWTPMAVDPAQAARGERNLMVVGRLRDGVSVDTAQAEMEAVASRLARAHVENEGMRAVVLPLREFYVRQGRPALYAMAVAVLLVLAVTCLNVANLLLARGATRSGEMAVRAALGARRSRVVRQLLTEAVVLSAIGGAFGLLLPTLAVRAILAAIPVPLPFWLQLTVDGRVLAFTAVVSVLTGVAFGLVPAFQASRADLHTLLKDRGAGHGGARRRMRDALVVGEVALSTVLLTCAGFMARSFVALQDIDPGFQAGSVLTAQIAPLSDARHPGDTEVIAFYAGLTERVRSLPGVTATGANSQIPLQQAGGTDAGLAIEARPELKVNGNFQVATPGYFRALGIPLAKGREFAASDAADAPGVVVVNQGLAARAWPGEEPLGRRLSVGGPDGPWLEVVGVAGDVRHRALDRDVLFDVYVPHAQYPLRAMTIVARTDGDPAALAGGLREAVRALDRDQPLHRVRTMEQVAADSLWIRRFNVKVFLVFAAVALSMAGVGLYGVVAYSVAQRTQEIGVRMALGASDRDVLRMVLRDGLRVVAIGLAIGLPTALGAGRALAAQLRGVALLDPLVLLGVPALLLLLSLLACTVPARRAARIPPLEALRHEGGLHARLVREPQDSAGAGFP